MAPRLRTLLTLPTNSSSSFASSTTSDGCSAQRARNWELSTLPGEDTAGPRPPPGPRPWPPMQNQSQKERGKASEQVQVQMLSAPKGTQGPAGAGEWCGHRPVWIRPSERGTNGLEGSMERNWGQHWRL